MFTWRHLLLLRSRPALLLLTQEARQRVEARFGPELPPGAEEYITLRPLPEGIQKLADQFRQQQEEAEKKQRVDNERRKVLQVSALPPSLWAALLSSCSQCTAAASPSCGNLLAQRKRRPCAARVLVVEGAAQGIRPDA